LLSRHDNERLTRVAAGTPMGNVFRRYWLPAALSSELPEPDGAPVRVRLLGEDLIAFRDSAGEIGLVEAFCPHRRAPLFFGRNEHLGLRCVYHGWKFDRTGTCVDLPTEPPDSSYKDKIRLDCYPTWEGGGIVWAYLGPHETMPAPPDFEFIRAAPNHSFMSKSLQDCNYLQALEGGLDSAHAQIMHVPNIGDDRLAWLADYERTVPQLTVEKTDYGFSYSGIRTKSGRQWVRIYQYIMPVTQMRGRIAPLRGGDEPPRIPTICGHLWVPIDDVTTAVYNFIYSYDPATPITPEFAMANEIADGRGPDELLPDFRLKRNMANDYLIDRQIQKTRSFTGIAGVNTQDVALQEGMGRILDRSKEHLGSTDRAITTMRQLLLEATDSVEAGKMPRGAHPHSYRGVRAVDHLIPEGEDWREALKHELRARF